MRKAVLLIAATVLAASCSSSKTPTPTPSPTVSITAADLENGVLTSEDMGKGWTAVKDPQPDTFQIGGRVGTETYLANATASKTVSFSQDNGSGFVTNTVMILPSTAGAEAVMAAHQNQPSTWRQQRTAAVGGGYLDAKLTGPVSNLDQLGDDSFSAHVDATIKPANGTPSTTRIVEYVAYRIGNVVSFVVAQDVGVKTYASKQEARLQRVIP
jgi:hypothetical protein